MTSVVRSRKLYPFSQGGTRAAPAAAIQSNHNPCLCGSFYRFGTLPSIPAPPADGEVYHN